MAVETEPKIKRDYCLDNRDSSRQVKSYFHNFKEKVVNCSFLISFCLHVLSLSFHSPPFRFYSLINFLCARNRAFLVFSRRRRRGTFRSIKGPVLIIYIQARLAAMEIIGSVTDILQRLIIKFSIRSKLEGNLLPKMEDCGAV